MPPHSANVLGHHPFERLLVVRKRTRVERLDIDDADLLVGLCNATADHAKLTIRPATRVDAPHLTVFGLAPAPEEPMRKRKQDRGTEQLHAKTWIENATGPRRRQDLVWRPEGA